MLGKYLLLVLLRKNFKIGLREKFPGFWINLESCPVALELLLCWGPGGVGTVVVLPGAGHLVELLLLHLRSQYVCVSEN